MTRVFDSPWIIIHNQWIHKKDWRLDLVFINVLDSTFKAVIKCQNIPFFLNYISRLLFTSCFWKDEVSTSSLLESLGGMGLSPNSRSWLLSSRPAGCCFALSELLGGRRRTTIAINQPVNKNHLGHRNPEVSAILWHSWDPMIILLIFYFIPYISDL